MLKLKVIRGKDYALEKANAAAGELMEEGHLILSMNSMNRDVLTGEKMTVICYDDGLDLAKYLERFITEQEAALQELRTIQDWKLDHLQPFFPDADKAQMLEWIDNRTMDPKLAAGIAWDRMHLKRSERFLAWLQDKRAELSQGKPATPDTKSSETSVIEVLLSKYRKQLRAAENWLSAHPNDASHLVQREVLLEIIRDLEAL